MKVLIILALCAAVAFADVTTVPPVNSTEVPVVPPKIREGRFLTLVNGYVYDRHYDVVLTKKEYDYYYVINKPVYTVSRDIEITY